MNCNKIHPGLLVRTVEKLGKTTGMLIHSKHLDCRKPNTTGTVLDWVPGHGGDVWFVKHAGHMNEVGAYCFDELEPLTPPPASPSPVPPLPDLITRVYDYQHRKQSLNRLSGKTVTTVVVHDAHGDVLEVNFLDGTKLEVCTTFGCCDPTIVPDRNTLAIFVDGVKI